MPRRTVKERFVDKVEFRGWDECWPWTRSINTYGYGQMRTGGRGTSPEGTHVIAYREFKGPIPTGHDVHHLCHEEAARMGLCDGGPTCPHRKCCNWNHLETIARGPHVFITHSKTMRKAA